MSDALNIAAFISVHGMGGSQNSSVTVCNALVDRGHRVTLYCPAEKMFSHVKPRCEIIDVPMSRVNPDFVCNVTAGNICRLVREVKRREHSITMTFNWRSMFFTLPTMALYNLPSVHYLLGPTTGPKMFRLFRGRWIANCGETRQRVCDILGCRPGDVPVVPSRVSLRDIEAGLRRSGSQNVFVPPEGLVQIGMMSAFRSGKITAVNQALDAMLILSQRGLPVRLLLAGDGPERSHVESRVAQTNQQAGRTIATYVGYTGDVADFLSAADIVLGVGRCVFEAMALSRPCIVVGDLGFAGSVSPDGIEKIAYHNFAGRNIDRPTTAQMLADELAWLVADRNRRSELGAFARTYMTKYLDVDAGAEMFEAILTREVQNASQSRLAGTRDLLSVSTYFAARAAKSLWRRVCGIDHPSQVDEEIRRIQNSGTARCVSQSLGGEACHE